ncbi:glycosyl transferase, family 2 [Trichodesmium erythraeum IMS101]|uniref:Glycosyl transferase, family 2 n=1 Tax=Trichodesmium erythraeum (strain IMS101) TaxID=203124 RepID=Q110P4_TRIEI|nr:glycosyltransferase family 2 protein [Trichodesmium erythraeum GBRTRLIN201]MCH2051304.1 glycosyltransferase family 2 protein [Trichodesmium sp. ALOHA_ZT_67]MDE5095919.1 glycosyltransferase family A protein [Trichodesmium sp. St11_bin5]
MSTTTTTPRVSVIIPVYNCDRYINQAIESIFAQTYQSYEIIVIDDGSTDNTRKTMEPYMEMIHYVYQQNQGVSAARNHGINLARGELIAFLDADDFFLPDKLTAQVKVFDAKPNLGIVHSGWRRVNQQGETIKDETPWDYVPKLNLEGWLRWKPIGTMGTLMFRRSWLQEVGSFEVGLGQAEDVDLVLRLSVKGCEAEWLRQSTICYRQHDQNTMRDGVSQVQSINRVLDKFFASESLPLEIRLLEKQLRYNTLVWCSWYLYYTGFSAEMVEYLQKSWQYTPFLPVGTVINWIESFTEFSENMGDDLDADKLGKTDEWQQLMGWVISNSGANY